jgi:hypothetical protein
MIATLYSTAAGGRHFGVAQMPFFARKRRFRGTKLGFGGLIVQQFTIFAVT